MKGEVRLYRARWAGVCLLTTLGVVGGAGCSASSYHKAADKTAADILKKKQQEAIGRQEPFTIETPADTLRRRLMIDQNLQRSSDASLSSKDVKPIKDSPEGATTRPSTQPSAGATTRAAVEPLRVSLVDALRISAHNSREYQTQKERIFIDALDLDLARNDFRTIFGGNVNSEVTDAPDGAGGRDTSLRAGTSLSAAQRFKNGATFLGAVSFDLVQMLSGDKSTSRGVAWDASITLPLLRGGGEYVVMEQLTQAERTVVYDFLNFEQFKRTFSVNIATQYLNVLSQLDQIRNADAAYRRAIISTRRATRQFDAGRLDQIQVDQAVQQELQARDRWIQATSSYGKRLDAFKVLLGLTPDTEIVLEPQELQSLISWTTQFLDDERNAATTVPTTSATTQSATAEVVLPPVPLLSGAGPVDMDWPAAISLALANRPDLKVRNGSIYDAQREVRVAANALQAGLDLTATAGGGGRAAAGRGTTNLGASKNVYSGGLLLDLPLERTAERNAYRISIIALESSVRALQQFEDGIKLDVRGDLRDLLLAREEIRIQARSVDVAQKRVDSTSMFMDAGRAQIRDVLDAQNALVQAQNSFTSAVITHRVTTLGLQRDLGLLEVNADGLWKEYQRPANPEQNHE